jgi:steroid 5-alpha reductase family enzyme
MSLPQLLTVNAIVIALMMTAIWLVSVALRDVSIVDIFWGLGFVLVTMVSFAMLGMPPGGWWLVLPVTAWGTRLSAYLAWRNWGKPEDYRYQAMRQKYGDRFWWLSGLIVFGLQGIIMWVVSLPLQVGMFEELQGSEVWPMRVIGILLFLVGWSFEAIGDWQLARFKRLPENRGKVFDQGLWRYTRHPNYFGDFLVWWGFFLIAWHDWQSTWTILSPLLMSYLLIRVSGVALLEKNLKQRSDEYVQYTRRTSAFFPWPPQKTP